MLYRVDPDKAPKRTEEESIESELETAHFQFMEEEHAFEEDMRLRDKYLDATERYLLAFKTAKVAQERFDRRPPVEGFVPPYPQDLVEELQLVERLRTEAKEAMQAFSNRAENRARQLKLRDRIQKEMGKRSWDRKQLSEETGLSPSTVSNLLSLENPDRRWTAGVKRLVEEGFGWTEGSFDRVGLGEDPIIKGSWADTGPQSSESGESGPRLSVRVNDELMEEVRWQAAREDRTVGRLVESALRLYLKTVADD